MTPDELLKPRYKVIADYPNSRFKIGDILFKYIYPSSESIYTYVTNPEIPLKGTSLSPEYVEKMNHLFKPLQWWEDRKAEDMPGYVKDERGVFKVKEWHLHLASNVTVYIDSTIHAGYVDCTECPLYSDPEPATEAEYITYINSK